LPKIKNESDIAPLKTTEPDAEAGILKYEHFAIILNRRQELHSLRY
jgi:hypothetical protein